MAEHVYTENSLLQTAERLKSCLPKGDFSLNPEICLRMLEAAELPDNIIRHVKAVSAKALLIAEALNRKGLRLDLKLIQNSALLHDICRKEKNHAAAGAKLIALLGFIPEADIIRQHHELDNGLLINEAAVVYLADKLVKEDQAVSLDERFRLSRDKCKSPEALAAHERRFSQAKKLLSLVQSILNE